MNTTARGNAHQLQQLPPGYSFYCEVNIEKELSICMLCYSSWAGREQNTLLMEPKHEAWVLFYFTKFVKRKVKQCMIINFLTGNSEAVSSFYLQSTNACLAAKTSDEVQNWEER